MIIIGPFVLAQMASGHVQVTSEEVPPKHQPGPEHAGSFGKLLTRYLGEDTEPWEIQEKHGAERPEPKKQGDPELNLVSLAAVFAPLTEQKALVANDVESQENVSASEGIEVAPARLLAGMPQDRLLHPPDNTGMEREVSLQEMEPVATEEVVLLTSSELPDVLNLNRNTDEQEQAGFRLPEFPANDAPVAASQPVVVQGPEVAEVITTTDETFEAPLEKLVFPEGLGQVTLSSLEDVEVKPDSPRVAVLSQTRIKAESEAEVEAKSLTGDPVQKLASIELAAVVSDVRPDLKKQLLLERQPVLQELVADVDVASLSLEETDHVATGQSSSMLRQPEVLEEAETDLAPFALNDEVLVEGTDKELTSSHQSQKMEQEKPVDHRARTHQGPSRERLSQVSSEATVPVNDPGVTLAHEAPEVEAEIRAVLDVQDRDNLFPKLVETIETLVQGERSEVRMQLKPDHLGTLEVKLSMERGIMVAEFIVQNQQVREIIASQLPQLQTALQDQGTQMADVSVSIGLGQKGTDGEGQERPKQPYQNRYGKLQKASTPANERAYLGRSIWNQVDVRV